MPGYFRLSTSSDEEQELQNEKALEQPESCFSRTWKLLPWIWCTICTIITILAVLNTTLRQSQSQCPAPEAPQNTTLPQPQLQCPVPEAPQNTASQPSRANFPTDFITAPEIPYIEKYYYNYWDFNPYKHHLDLNETMLKVGPMYAGYPTKEIDEAWKELLEGSYMEATEEEIEAVKQVAPWDLEEIKGHTYMEVGVFHNLHCIDLIRRALNPEVYNIHTDFTGQIADRYRQTHIYHCIDHLRQAVSCHGDMTPVPMFSIPELPGFYASHSVSHTCRDFEKIKEWREERNKKREPFGY